MSFPIRRMRRLRRTPTLRRMVRETTLSPANFIGATFVVSGRGVREEISSMPGVHRLSPELVVEQARELAGLGVPALILFGIPESKSPGGEAAWDPAGPVPEALRQLKQADTGLVTIADVCLCEYTDHGHCGVLDEHGGVRNDATLELLARAAVAYARAGADVVAPSDMMDGRVGAIREALDHEGLEDTAILAYAAKYASAFYGPFRDAAGSTPAFGDRRGYQMDPANRREALAEVLLDLDEGADLVMVKPALAYLDVIREVRDLVDVPVAAYNVSGEYAMVKAAVAAGALDERRAVLEVLTAIRRAGADLILTYHAAEASRWLAEGGPTA